MRKTVCVFPAGFGSAMFPTLLFFKGGEVKDQVVGLTSKADLISRLKTLN
jgi:hypothetical protein